MKEHQEFEEMYREQGFSARERKDARWNNISRLDVDLKQKRDAETPLSGFVEGMNHKLREWGQRGFSYGTINKLMGKQISELALRTKDRRILEFIDQIETPGGNWGNTSAGRRLKEVTINKIESEIEASEAEERARWNHDRTKLATERSMAIAELLKEKYSLTDPQEIAAKEQEIKDLLLKSATEGVGSQVSLEHGRIAKALESPNTITRQALLTDEYDLEGDSKQTIKEKIIETLKDSSTDVSEEARKHAISNVLTNIVLDKDGKELVGRINAEYQEPTTIKEFTAPTKKRVDNIVDNHLLRFNTNQKQFNIMPTAAKKPVPDKFWRQVNLARRRIKRLYVETFDRFSNELEFGGHKYSTSGEAVYGYKGWSPEVRGNFEEKFLKVLDDSGLVGDLDNNLAVFDKKEEKRKKTKDVHKENIETKMVGKESGPRSYKELQLMFFDEDEVDNHLHSLLSTQVTFQTAITGLALGSSKEARKLVDKLGFGDSLKDWVKEAVAGSDDPKLQRQQLSAIWDWGTYLIRREQIERIERSSRTTSEKESEIKGLPPADKMPETSDEFIKRMRLDKIEPKLVRQTRLLLNKFFNKD